MLIQGQISDQKTGLPLQLATLSYDCSQGGACNPVGLTNAGGNYSIIIPDTNRDILISYVGYKSVLVNASILQNTPLIQLVPNPQDLQEVTVVATPKNVNAWYLAGGAAILYLLFVKKGKKKIVSGINPETTKLLTTGVIAVGAYFLIAKPLLQKLNILPSAEQSQTLADQKAALDASLAAAMQTANPNFSDATFSGFADSIYTTITSLFYKGSTVTDILKQMLNDTDVLKLAKAYGTRQKCFALGYGCTDQILSSAITDSLNSSEIADVNSDYANKGIKFRF